MGLGSILSMKSVWINAGFLYPGRVYTQTPTAILFTATLDATRTTPVAVQPLAAGDMIFLLDDSTRLRYPTKHIGGSLDVATRDAAFSNTHDILGALIPVTDFIRIAAARKVEMSIPDYHFTMSGDARHALAALVGVLTPDSAVAK
jgi:hypothetical protein